MAFAVYVFLALICGAYANPLAQTTVCESAANIPLFGPTVLENLPYPYLPIYPYQYKQVCETTPNLLPYYPVPLPYTGTVCETTTSPVPVWPGYPLPLPAPGDPTPTIVCQTIPALPTKGATICETNDVLRDRPQNVISVYPYPGLLPSVGPTSCCETAPNVLPIPGLPGFIPGLPPYLPSMNFL